MYKLFLGDEWLELSVNSIAPYVRDVVLVVSDIPWGSVDVKGDDLEPIIRRLQKRYGKKIHLVKGSWKGQLTHIRAGLHYIKTEIPSATHCLYIDSDEIYLKRQIKKLVKLSWNPRYFNRQIRWNYRSYFKDVYHVIFPETYPLALVSFPLRSFVEFEDIRAVNLGIENMPFEYFEHFSYVRKTDEAIKRKIEAHKESEPIRENWFEKVWMNWTPDQKNFHPTVPEFWPGVKEVKIEDLPDGVMEAFENWPKEVSLKKQ